MRSEKPSWPRILRRHCTEGLDGWTFTKKATIAVRGRERQYKKCTVLQLHRNAIGMATQLSLSLSFSLSVSMYQCCLSHRWLALGWGTGPGLIAHGTQRNFERKLLHASFMNVLSDLSPSRSRTLGHYPWTAQISWCWLPRRLQVLVACGWLVEGTQDRKRLNLRGA